MNICGLETLVKFQPHCEPAALDNALNCFTNDFKHLNTSNDFFILSQCTNHAYVLLSPSLGIYLLNGSMELGYICEGFMEYIRLAMLHYMLDGWECFLLGNADAIPYEHVSTLHSSPFLPNPPVDALSERNATFVSALWQWKRPNSRRRWKLETAERSCLCSLLMLCATALENTISSLICLACLVRGRWQGVWMEYRRCE